MFLPLWLMHRHPRFWPHPDAFDPGRFEGAQPDRSIYLPFGIGPQTCIGAQLALCEAVLVAARVLRQFHVERIDDAPIVPRALVTIHPDRLPLCRFRVRH